MRNCSMHPLNPFLFFFLFRREVGVGVEFLDFCCSQCVPNEFSACFSSFQCVPQLVLISTSLCHLWFPQCCPLGTLIRVGSILGLLPCFYIWSEYFYVEESPKFQNYFLWRANQRSSFNFFTKTFKSHKTLWN